MRFRKDIFPYLLISPLLIIMIIFIFYPACITVIDSFKSINMLRPWDVKFVGIANYIALFKDADVINSVKNTGIYYVLSVFAEVIVGLGIALVLKDKFKGRGILLAIVILPWALPPVVNGLIWKWIYHPYYGLLNDILFRFGAIDQFRVWLGNPDLSKFFIAVVHVWKMIPFAVVIFLAKLQTISRELYEAAQIDGAGKIDCFKSITFPALKPALLIVLTHGTITVLHLFDEIYVLTGTDLDTRSILIENYLIAFRNFKLSLGMALSFLSAWVVLIFTGFYMFFLKEAKEE